MNYLGIDIGSSKVKLCFEKDGEKYFYLIDTFDFYRFFFQNGDFSLEMLQEHFSLSNLREEDVGITGYGRNRVKFWPNSFNEMKMHYRGALFQSGLKNFILLDIGGQDTKVILVKNGKMVDFKTNDRCAAGTGKFLENSARVMKVDLKDFSTFKNNPVNISSKCTVFAETEIIELISRGYPVKEIAAGLNLSIVKKIMPLLEPFLSETDKLVFAGGTAQSPAVNFFLTQELEKEGIELVKLKYPIYNGAIGIVETIKGK